MLKLTKLLMFVLGLNLLYGFTSSINLAKVRQFYDHIQINEAYADSIVKLTSNYTKLGAEAWVYHGAAQCAKAQFYINPISKYNQCKKGLDIINNAANKHSNVLEVRYVRFTIETNLPSIMPFTDHQKADKAFVLANINAQHSNYLRIKSFLLKYGNLTESEKKKLN